MADSRADNGIVSLRSNHSVDESVARLRAMLESKGIVLFAFVNNSGEAAKVGLRMRPTKLLIFGSPKAGTLLMVAAPNVAIDLPLKMLVAEDESGQAWISYNSPEYLRRRHGIPVELMPVIASVTNLAEMAAK